jgi:GTP cyclohydrolase II
VSKIRLVTNNPRKFEQLTTLGIEITARVPVVVPTDEYSKGYIETKRRRMGHWL